MGVPDDFPEVAVGVVEVAGIDPPGPVVRLGDRGAGELRPAEQLVDLLPALHELTEAERACLRREEVDFGVQRKVAAGVQAEDQAVVELEQCHRTVRARALVGPVGPDDPFGCEAKAVTVKGERALEVVDSECDDVHAWLHGAHLLM
jgi:hypothetical protein